jgi:hypothetical protein
MIDIAVLRAIPEIERKERETESLVLRDVTKLVAPDRGRRLVRRDDDVPERDRAEAASREDKTRETAIAHVQKTAIAPAWPRAGKEAECMSDRISVMRDEAPKRDVQVADTQKPGRTP